MRERAKSGTMSVTAVIMKGPLSYLIIVLVFSVLILQASVAGTLDRHVRCCT